MMRVLRLLSIIFLCLALAFVLIGYFVNLPGRILKVDGLQTQGVVTGVDHKRGRTTVSYTVRGETYETTLNVYSSSLSSGDPIELYVAKDDPHRIATPVEDTLSFVFNLLAAVFAAVGLVLAVLARRGEQLRQRLLSDGERIIAQIVEVRPNPRMTFKGRHPYRLLCQAVDPATGAQRDFWSDNIFSDPAPDFIRQDIDVCIDPQNRHQYTVDLQSAMQPTAQSN